MPDRIPLDEMTDDALDALYDQRDADEAAMTALGAGTRQLAAERETARGIAESILRAIWTSRGRSAVPSMSWDAAGTLTVGSVQLAPADDGLLALVLVEDGAHV